MDVVRSLLLIALLVLIWSVRLGTARPIRDFLEWGRSHLFLFLVNSVMIGIVWGFLGREYGLQGLFLQDNAVLEFLAGTMVMLLFLRMDLQHFVLDESQANWTQSVKRSINFLLGTAEWVGHKIEVQRWLRDGFLEHLNNEDLDTIRRRLDQQRYKNQRSAVADLVQIERFRLLFSPAVLLVSAVVLLPILGLVPAILMPLASGDNLASVGAHLPWLLGTIVGAIAGVWLASWSARRLDAARMRACQLQAECLLPGWSVTRHRMLVTIKQDASSAVTPTETADGQTRTTGSTSNTGPRDVLLGFLLSFFVIHGLAPQVAPVLMTLNYLEPIPGEELTLWWPLAVLALEAALAAVALIGWRLVLSAPVSWLMRKLAIALYGVAVALTPLERRLEIDWRARLALLYLPISVVIVALNFTTVQRGESVVRGIGASILVLLFLGALSATFSLGTSLGLLKRARPLAWGTAVSHGTLFAVTLFSWQANWFLVSFTTGLALTCWLAAPLAASAQREFLRSLPWILISLAFFSVLGFYLASLPSGMWKEAAPAFVLGVNIVLLGGAAMRRVVRSAWPLYVYGFSAAIGFVGFALAYDGLPEVTKAFMPSAISIVCLFGVIASVYTLVAATWKDRTAMVLLAACAVLLIVNGNSWLRTPNQFKLSFPGLESYYRAPAVLLNSESYFRDTMPSVVKLYYAGPHEIQQARPANPERLASAELSLADVASSSEGLDLTVREFSGRIRPRDGDLVRAVKTNDYQQVVLERSSDDGTDSVRIPLSGFLESQIYREFHDMTVQFMRSGAPVGAALRLALHHPKERHGPVEPIRDAEDEFAARTSVSWSATWEFDAAKSALVLIGLPRFTIPSGVDQVSLSTRWNGVVLPENSWPVDGFRIRLHLLRNAPALKQEQRDELRRYLTNCYLIHQRPTFPITESGQFDVASLDLARPGDCAIIEDVAPESPVTVGTFLISSEKIAPPFDRHVLHVDSVANLLAADRQQTAIGGRAPKYQVRIVYDRGVFAVAPSSSAAATTSVSLYNGKRVRPGDRLVLHWSHGDDNQTETGGVFTVVKKREPGGASAGTLPRGFWQAELLAEDGAASLPVVSGDKSTVGNWQILRPLDNYESLQWWQKSVGRAWSRAALSAGAVQPEETQQVKPPLVIVTVSGGGIRASVWTVAVLRKLEEELGPAFPRHVRLITGASGGMVGGTYYAGTTDADSPAGNARSGITLDDIVARMASDQLDAVIGQFIFSDIPGALNPFPHETDRGRVLESTWKRLAPGAAGEASPFDRRLQTYAADELLGRRPSLVYTPMMVEDGRRLLISNLDLSFVARNLGGILLESESRKINHLAYFEDKSDREILLKDDVISLSAIEFFRIFPEARDFRMSTAMRMSASFPWVSPAVSLPTSPPRRVVDAAYYDNYGVNMAAMWLTELRDWLAARTSGVVVIQIRDHISQTARTNLDFDRETPGASQGSAGLLDNLTWQANRRILGPGSQSMTTPLSGISSARQWTMSYRNDEQVELLDELFGEAAGSAFFRTVVFECPIEASLSWNLSIAERQMIENGFGEPVRVKDYFGADAAEHARWQDENRDAPDYPLQLKARIDEQLRALGFAPKARGSLRSSEELYKNVLNNRKRLVLLKDWWDSKRRPLPTPMTPSRSE
jgi:hypothetical protein